MPPNPGEPNEKITLNVFKRDMDLLRARYPRGGHLTFIKRLVRAWADAERGHGASVLVTVNDDDEATETLKSLARTYP